MLTTLAIELKYYLPAYIFSVTNNKYHDHAESMAKQDVGTKDTLLRAHSFGLVHV